MGNKTISIAPDVPTPTSKAPNVKLDVNSPKDSRMYRCGPSLKLGLRRSVHKNCDYWSCGRCSPCSIQHSGGFRNLPINVIAQTLRYLDATEAIYLEACCTLIGTALSDGGWCESLILDGLWRCGPGNSSLVHNKWFPKLTALKSCYHPFPPQSISRRTDDAHSLPSTASTMSNDTHRHEDTPRGSLNDACKWADLLPCQLAPVLSASSGSLKLLEVQYLGSFNNYRMRPIPKAIEMKRLSKMIFTVDSKDSDTLAIDSEGIVVAFKNVKFPECTSIQIGGASKGSMGNSLLKPINGKGLTESDEKSHGASRLVVEAFGYMITGQPATGDLSIEMTSTDAELLTHVLPNVLEV